MKIVERDSLRLSFPIVCACEGVEWFVQIDKEEKTGDFKKALETLDSKYEEL